MRRRRIAIAVPTTDGLDAAAWQIAWAYRCPHMCECYIHASLSTTSGPAAPWRCAAAWGAGLLGGALPAVRAGGRGPARLRGLAPSPSGPPVGPPLAAPGPPPRLRALLRRRR